MVWIIGVRHKLSLTQFRFKANQGDQTPLVPEVARIITAVQRRVAILQCWIVRDLCRFFFF